MNASNMFSQRAHWYCLRNILSNRILTDEWRNDIFSLAGDHQLQHQSQSQVSKTELLAKMVNSFKWLTIFAKRVILDA